jgi:hypothetical protein
MQNENPRISAQYQTLFIVWVSLLISQLLFLLLVYIIKPELLSFDFTQPLVGENAIVVGIFALLALSAVAASFFFRKRDVERGIAEQKVEHVQTGMIMGCALCEVSSLLGLMLAFAFDYQYFFLWMGLGIIGTLLHIPKKSDIIAASYKK